MYYNCPKTEIFFFLVWLQNTVTRMCFFFPVDVFVTQDNADPVLLGDHDVALASIDKVVVGK